MGAPSFFMWVFLSVCFFSLFPFPKLKKTEELPVEVNEVGKGSLCQCGFEEDPLYQVLGRGLKRVTTQAKTVCSK